MFFYFGVQGVQKVGTADGTSRFWLDKREKTGIWVRIGRAEYSGSVPYEWLQQGSAGILFDLSHSEKFAATPKVTFLKIQISCQAEKKCTQAGNHPAHSNPEAQLLGVNSRRKPSL